MVNEQVANLYRVKTVIGSNPIGTSKYALFDKLVKSCGLGPFSKESKVQFLHGAPKGANYARAYKVQLSESGENG